MTNTPRDFVPVPREAMKIITSHVYPPIPWRGNDWCAYYDGTEESGPIGWGETEAKAVTDLKDNYDEQ